MNQLSSLKEQQHLLPLPPIELRRSVGPEDPAAFDNPTGVPVFGSVIPIEAYERVLDFGCGCGRIARQMIQQTTPPQRYLGLDLYRPSIEWAAANLSRKGFEFRHLNAFNLGFNPKGQKEAPFNTEEVFTLVNAHSVFTHIVEDHVKFYFEQCVARLRVDGVMRATWFLFDKTAFPMMQEFQNCLYINTVDPTNATIYDVAFVQRLYRQAGLRIASVTAPAVRGHQWVILADQREGEDAQFPADEAPTGIVRPPRTLSGG